LASRTRVTHKLMQGPFHIGRIEPERHRTTNIFNINNLTLRSSSKGSIPSRYRSPGSPGGRNLFPLFPKICPSGGQRLPVFPGVYVPTRTLRGPAKYHLLETFGFSKANGRVSPAARQPFFRSLLSGDDRLRFVRVVAFVAVAIDGGRNVVVSASTLNRAIGVG